MPYGYRPVPHPGGAGAALDIDPDEAAVVRRVADTILKDRRTLNSVVAELNAEGVKPRRAARWTLRSLQGILLSPASLGRIAYQGDVVRDDRGLPVQAWPPVLAPEEQLMLRPLITGNPRKPRRRAARLLSGLALCDSCGGTLSVRSYSGGASYGCTADARGRVCEAPVYVKAELIEAEVERRFLATYGFFKMTEEIETAPDDPGLVVVEEAIRDTASALAKPGVDVAALAARMADLHAERERLAAAPKRRESLLVESDRTFAEEWEGASIERRRALLRSSGAEIRVLRPVGGRRWTPERVVMRFS